MKKIVSIILLVFAFTLNAEAQKKGRKPNAEKMLKKMSSELNLTDDQQAKIKPLLIAELAERKVMNKKRKAMKESGEKPSREQRKEMRKERLAKETAMNSKLANILDKEQFAKYEKIQKEKKEMQRKKWEEKRKNNK